MKNKLFTALVAILLAATSVYAQGHEATEEAGDLKKHSIAIELGYTYLPTATAIDGTEGSIFVPTYGLAYAYRINHKWGLGLGLNMESGNYIIEANREDLERKNVFIIAAVGSYEPLPNWAVYFGGGIELETHKNYALLRVGTEYSFELKNDWRLGPMFTVDYKLTDYSSYEFAVFIGKRF